MIFPGIFIAVFMIKKWLAYPIILLVKLYQITLSPLMGFNKCRYIPTCSQYAIEALQKFGYNKGDAANYIPTFGIDGIPAAQDLIQKGLMTGTVVEYPNDTALALYAIGINLVNNKPPLEDTDYKFDKTGFIVRIPYRGILSAK